MPILCRLSILVLLACVAAGAADSNKLVFVLFDLSDSTRPAAAGSKNSVRDQYLKEFRFILDSLKAGDAIVADGIRDNPLTQANFPVNEQLKPSAGWFGNPLREKAEFKQAKDKIQSGVENLFRNAPNQVRFTKILDAMQLADRVFASIKRDRKVLVIFSDMVEESDRYNFITQPPSSARAQQVLKQEQARRALPRLKGVEVYVSGAGAGSYGNAGTDTIQAIKDFWLKYFGLCGANLPPERYGSALLTFNP
jgi:hypothetical protein